MFSGKYYCTSYMEVYFFSTFAYDNSNILVSVRDTDKTIAVDVLTRLASKKPPQLLNIFISVFSECYIYFFLLSALFSAFHIRV